MNTNIWVRSCNRSGARTGDMISMTIQETI